MGHVANHLQTHSSGEERYMPQKGYLTITANTTSDRDMGVAMEYQQLITTPKNTDYFG